MYKYHVHSWINMTITTEIILLWNSVSCDSGCVCPHWPLCHLREQTVGAAGRRWCPGCKWGRTGSRSAASSKCCLGFGRGKSSAPGWTTRSSSTPEKPKASTARTLGLRTRQKMRWWRRSWRKNRQQENWEWGKTGNTLAMQAAITFNCC